MGLVTRQAYMIITDNISLKVCVEIHIHANTVRLWTGSMVSQTHHKLCSVFVAHCTVHGNAFWHRGVGIRIQSVLNSTSCTLLSSSLLQRVVWVNERLLQCPQKANCRLLLHSFVDMAQFCNTSCRVYLANVLMYVLLVYCIYLPVRSLLYTTCMFLS